MDWSFEASGCRSCVSVSHEAMQEIFNYEMWKYHCHRETGWVWNCFPVVFWYCDDIPEGNDISCVKHIMSVRRPWIIRKATVKNIKKLCAAKSPILSETKNDHELFGKVSE